MIRPSLMLVVLAALAWPRVAEAAPSKDASVGLESAAGCFRASLPSGFVQAPPVYPANGAKEHLFYKSNGIEVEVIVESLRESMPPIARLYERAASGVAESSASGTRAQRRVDGATVETLENLSGKFKEKPVTISFVFFDRGVRRYFERLPPAGRPSRPCRSRAARVLSHRRRVRGPLIGRASRGR